MTKLKQIESADLESQAKDNVQASFFLFAVMCVAIRMTPFIVHALSS